MISVRVSGEDGLGRVAGRLRRAQGHLRRELTTAIREAAQPAVRDLKREMASVPMPGQRKPGAKHPFEDGSPSRGTRARIARSIELRLSTSAGGPTAEFRIRPVGADIEALVKYLTGSASRSLRHPVMGNRSVWVGQGSSNVWWPVLKRHLPRFNREIEEAVATVERRLDG